MIDYILSNLVFSNVAGNTLKLEDEECVSNDGDYL